LCRQTKRFSFSVILEVAMGFDPRLWNDPARVARLEGLWQRASSAMFALPINLAGTGIARCRIQRVPCVIMTATIMLTESDDEDNDEEDDDDKR
jgi:hypothetical protein